MKQHIENTFSLRIMPWCLGLFLVPSAANATCHKTITGSGLQLEFVLCHAFSILDTLVYIAFALILLAFFWGLSKYVFQAGDETAVARGKRIMVGGILALFVAFMLFGIILWAQNELGVGANKTNTIEVREPF
ncbi:MAG: hypothetical protein WDZ79_02435 [Candidatus Paceibacterota bacterium]